jgi:hypothetical protein
MEGSLSMRCNTFTNTGSIIVGFAALDMSTEYDGGMNTFRSVENCIRLEEADALFLQEGGNDFSGCVNSIMVGTMDTLCGNTQCEIVIPASHNYWGVGSGPISTNSGLAYPPQNQLHLVSAYPAFCGGYEGAMECEIVLMDTSPAEPAGCIETTKSISVAYTNPSMEWTNFLQGLQSAHEEGTFELYDAKGALVVSKPIHGGEFLSLSEYNLSSGMYLFSVRSQNSRTSVVRMVD